MNLLAAPFVAIVVPKALPARLVLVALPLAVTLLIREHPHLNRSALPWMVGGALPGTTLGLLIVGHVRRVDLAIVVGAITLVGVALGVVSPPIKVNAFTATAAGLTSQVFGTASSVGGPPVALLLQHHPGPAAREGARRLAHHRQHHGGPGALRAGAHLVHGRRVLDQQSRARSDRPRLAATGGARLSAVAGLVAILRAAL